MSLGIWQIALIVLVVFLIFGAGKLPNVMGDLAKGVRNFKKGLEEDDHETAALEKSKDSNVEAEKSKDDVTKAS